MRVVLLLLVGALVAHGHPVDHSGNGLEFVLRNISALWEEVNDLRQEVNHHLHDGHSELSHDQILEETAILQHEHHVHHLNHPHEGHNDHHNNEMLQHLSTHHGHQRGGQPGREDPGQDDGIMDDDDQDNSQEAAQGHSIGHPEDDHDRHGLHSDEDDQDPLQDDDDPEPHTHCLKCQRSHGHGHKHRRGHAHGRGHGHAHDHAHGHNHTHGHDHGPGHTHEHEEGHEHGDSHENEDGHEHTHGHGHAHGHSHAHGHDHGPGHTHQHEEGHEHGDSHENEDSHDHDHRDPNHNRLHSDEDTLPGRRPQQKQQQQERWVHAFCNLKPNADLPGSFVRGNITISQRRDSKGPVYFDLDLTGFDVSQGRLHGFHIHENPASEYRCGTAGGHFNPFSVAHGGPSSTPRHVGDLGNIEVDENGELHGYIVSDTQVAFLGPSSIVNKAIVVHAREDDLGLGGHPDSLTTGNAGGRLACCNISFRSRVGFRFKG